MICLVIGIDYDASSPDLDDTTHEDLLHDPFQWMRSKKKDNTGCYNFFSNTT